ncbi:MAG: Fe(3+) ABC transporter substrate-binding protein [Gammaproteobacteria bacterium]|nr:Fe(3+) ABC transporter substrate-binding protein [Gammaproteobacteria bacterium]
MRPLIPLLAVLWLAGCSEPATDQLFVYSARHYDSDNQLYAAFTARTGIEVSVLQGGSDELIERMTREGIASPADVLITVDAGRLWRAEQAGVLQPVSSEVLDARIPAHLRHPDGLWYGFSQRLRVIFYDPTKVDPAEVSRYEDLASEELQGGVCVRSSNNIYNQSLLASLVSRSGVEEATAWTRGLVANLARQPQGGDTDQILGVASGECELALANHYYYVRLAQSDEPERRAAAQRVGIIFPNQDDRGVHVNVGGAAMARHAPNRDNALKFLEFLASDEAQSLFALGNHEFPVVAGIELDPMLAGWGELVLDDLNVAELGVHNPEAVRIADRVGWR